jgi:hypothetical protein
LQCLWPMLVGVQLNAIATPNPGQMFLIYGGLRIVQPINVNLGFGTSWPNVAFGKKQPRDIGSGIGGLRGIATQASIRT